MGKTLIPLIFLIICYKFNKFDISIVIFNNIFSDLFLLWLLFIVSIIIEIKNYIKKNSNFLIFFFGFFYLILMFIFNIINIKIYWLSDYNIQSDYLLLPNCKIHINYLLEIKLKYINYICELLLINKNISLEATNMIMKLIIIDDIESMSIEEINLYMKYQIYVIKIVLENYHLLTYIDMDNENTGIVSIMLFIFNSLVILGLLSSIFI